MALSFSCNLILPDTNNKYHSLYNECEASSTVTFITFNTPLPPSPLSVLKYLNTIRNKCLMNWRVLTKAVYEPWVLPIGQHDQTH